MLPELLERALPIDFSTWTPNSTFLDRFHPQLPFSRGAVLA